MSLTALERETVITMNDEDDFADILTTTMRASPLAARITPTAANVAATPTP